MKPLPANSALIIIDVQKGFDDPYWGKRNNPQAESNIAKLLQAWRAAKRPVFHVQHMSTEPNSTLRPGQRGNEIKDEVKPLKGEPIIRKCVNSSFIGTDLESRLRKDGIDTLILTGMTTNHCVSTTTRMAGNLGFKAYLVSDGTAAFETKGPDGVVHSAEQMHSVGLAELHKEFAQVVSTEEVLA